MMCIGDCGRTVAVEEVDDYGMCVTCSTQYNTSEGTLCDVCNTSVLIYADEVSSGYCDLCEETGMHEAPWYKEYLKSKSKDTSGIVLSKGTRFSPAPVIPHVKCTHTGSPEVFKFEKGIVFAGGDRDVADWDLDPVNLIVKLNGHPEPVIRVNPEATKMLKKFPHLQTTKLMPYLSVDWPDMGAPPLTKEFVGDLVRLVTEGTNILVHCMGGHGRTGTLLAAIGIESGAIPSNLDPVAWVRKHYCEKAVESYRQFTWLEETYDFKCNGKTTPSNGTLSMSYGKLSI